MSESGTKTQQKVVSAVLGWSRRKPHVLWPGAAGRIPSGLKVGLRPKSNRKDPQDFEVMIFAAFEVFVV